MDKHEVDLKRFDVHGEVRRFAKGRFEVVQIGGLSIGRATYEPGWRWSEHVGPSVGAARCPVEHVGLVVSGAAAVAFDDGNVVTLRVGELFHIPPVPHDSWVIGDEQYVSLHLLGAGHYATSAPHSEDRDAQCFVCGSDNSKSLGVAFERDSNRGSRAHYVARAEHVGWPGLLHGGVLFSLLDDAVGWAARFDGQPSVTSRASIRYRQPVPTEMALQISGTVHRRGRVMKAAGSATRVDTGDVVAELEALLFPRP